jgi:DNA-binding response OmpR family regulator
MDPKAKVLIIDDDRDYHAAMTPLLKNAGYEVCSAYTKEGGLAALKEQKPDLVILDIMMTMSTDGFHFLYEVRAEAGDKAPPILAVSCIETETGYHFSPEEDEEYFPADDFLRKPVDPDELIEHIENLLAARHAAEPD